MDDFKRHDMLYDDGEYYKWTASKDNDNPFFRGGKDAKELNRTEGFEVLYFINNDLPWKGAPDKKDYQKAEKMIRISVPKDIHDRKEIAKWICDNFKTTK